MKGQQKNLADWKKQWLHSKDLGTLTKSLNHIDKVYEEVRNSIGRVLMSMEMIEIQEILEDRIEQLSAQQASTRVAA